MRELKNKMLYTLFFAFSILVAVITAAGNYQSWMAARDELQQSMAAIAEVASEYLNPNEIGPWSSQWKSGADESSQNVLSLIYDNPAWIVSLNISRQPVQIYASDPEHTDTEQISAEAAEILHHHEPGSMQSDLFAPDGLCWYIPSNRSLILVDPSQIRLRLLRELFFSLVTALLFEIGLFLICRKAAQWMIAPIEATMEKQKQFIADASHELKTPLAVIVANAEAMEKDPSFRWLDNIKEEAQRMNGLVTSLLDLTRAEQTKPSLQRVDFSRLVEKQCLIMEAVLFEKKLELKEHIEEGIFVEGDPSALQQVCAILLDNAAEHSDGLVEVRLRRQKKEAVLQVINSGKPIPPEQRERIFERFYRGDTARTRQSGRYGLGLAIAKSLVDSHQGTIRAACENGRTDFTVILRAAS